MKNGKTPRRFSLGLKLNLLVVCMILLVTGGLVTITYQVQARRISEEYYKKAEEAAATGASLVSGDVFQFFRELTVSDEYRKVRQQAVEAQDEKILENWLARQVGALLDEEYFEQLEKEKEEGNITEEELRYASAWYDYFHLVGILELIQESEEVTYAYLQYVENGVTYNIADPEMGLLDVGTVEEPIPEFAQYKGNERIPATIYKSRFGWLCTACEPIYSDITGEAVGQLCIDIDMNVVMRERRAFLLNSLFLVLMLTIISILISIFLIRWIAVRPLQKLARATCGFQGFDEGRKRYEMKDVIDVDIRSNDEINDLYQEIRGMQTRMVKFTGDLAHYTAEKARLNTELGLASEIQTAMLKETFPDRPEFDLFALMDPARQIGGDFYDFFLIDENHLGLIIADVSGKGVPAALYMMSSVILLRNQARSGGTPAEIFAEVNKQLCDEEDVKMFVTAWMGILDLQTGNMTCANAGHEFPVIGPAGEDFSLLRDKHNFVLGGMENAQYSNYQIRLNPGDVLLVYTDGVPEASNPDKAFYGTDRLIQALNAVQDRTPKTILKELRADVDRFVDGAEQFDDITMLCLKYNGPADSQTAENGA